MRSYRQAISVIGLAVVLALLVGACAPGPAAAPAAPTPAPQAKPAESKPAAPAAAPTQAPAATAAPAKPAAATSEPYRIALLGPMTGSVGYAGTGSYIGAEVKAEEVNAKGGIGGRKIELIKYDTEGNAEKAVTFWKRAVEVDKVAAVLGPVITGSCNAVKPLLQQNQGPLTVCLSAGFTAPADIPMFNGTNIDISMQADSSLAYVQKQLGAKTIAILYSTDDTGQTGNTRMQDTAKKLGVQVILSESYTANALDFTPQLTKIKAAKPDVLFTTTFAAAAGVFAKNLKQVNYDPPIISLSSVASQQTIDLLKGVEPSFWVAPQAKVQMFEQLPADHPDRKRIEPIVAKMRARDPNVYLQNSGSGYDGMTHVARALEAVGPDAGKMWKWLEQNTKDLPAFAGTLTLSSTDHRGLGRDAVIAIKLQPEGKGFAIAPGQ